VDDTVYIDEESTDYGYGSPPAFPEFRSARITRSPVRKDPSMRTQSSPASASPSSARVAKKGLYAEESDPEMGMEADWAQ